MRPLCTSGYRVTRYVVAAHAREPVVFDTEEEAREAAAKRGEARIYQVTGEPLTDLWRRPVLVAEFADEAPRVALAS